MGSDMQDIPPRLLNICLKLLDDDIIRGFGMRCHKYADETLLFLSTASACGEVIQALEHCLRL